MADRVTGERTEVACAGCTECCRSNQALVLQPAEGDDVASYQHQVLQDRVSGEPVFALAADEKGWCVYLGERGCTIYERRPHLCRSFDCRKHYLMLPRQDRDNLVRIGLSSRAVFKAGRARLKTLSEVECTECVQVREEYFS
jgi:Fe-S-cluster containining protein